MEYISYLSLAGFAPATIQLYVAGVRTHLRWRSLPTFSDSYVIKMMLKGVSSQHLLPDIRLPVTRPILHQMCDALFFVIKDRYMVSLYRSMLTLAFNGLLRPGEFTYSPHVIRVENVYLHEGSISLLFPSTKAHNKPFPQKVEVHPCQQHCPVQYLKDYLQLRPPGPGALFVKDNGIPIQYPQVLALFEQLAFFLDLPPQCYKPHSIRIGATTELHVLGFSNVIIQERGRWSSQAFRRYIRC